MSASPGPRRTTHPATYRVSILLAALVAVGVWWGLGLPYSVATWLLDERQLYWTLVCYGWEVPAAGLLGPVLVPQLWWRGIIRQWDRAFAVDPPDPTEAGIVEGMILDFPIRVAWVFIWASLGGYAIGALQLAVFAQLPPVQIMHVCVLGVVTGLLGGTLAFLYLEGLLAPLLRDLGPERVTAPPAGRRVPIRTKVFACGFVLMVCTVPLFGTLFWNQGARVLEEEAGKRMLGAAERVAQRVAARATLDVPSVAEWRALTADLEGARLVDGQGRTLVGARTGSALAEAGFRASLVETILTSRSGQTVDRTWVPRIVAFAATGVDGWRVVVVVPRSALDHQLRRGLVTAAVIFAATLALALLGGYLFARRLSRPIEIVTAAANRTAQTPSLAGELTVVRTNDEVGELAIALNNMTLRLHALTRELTRYSGALEERVREATREVTTLYDTTRAVTATLDEADVLRQVGERVGEALGVRDLVLLRYSPHDGTAGAYAPGHGRIELSQDVDLSAVSEGSLRPLVCSLAEVSAKLPPVVCRLVHGPRVLCVPLPFKGLLIGVILASVEPNGTPNLDLAAALGAQVAVALANVGLFETVQRHEGELLELMERQIQLREETSRDISRELHDGMGQSLTAVKIELGLLQRDAPHLSPTEVSERTQRLQGYVADVIQEVRTMSQLLRPTMLDDLGLVPSIRSHVEGVGARAGIATELHLPEAPPRLSAPVELLLYRVTQEAFTNIAKHARAGRAEITLSIGGGRAALTIIDDGVGFASRNRGSGIGLLGMRERVAYHGGRIEIWSAPGEGTRIHVVVPVEPASDAGVAGA